MVFYSCRKARDSLSAKNSAEEMVPVTATAVQSKNLSMKRSWSFYLGIICLISAIIGMACWSLGGIRCVPGSRRRLGVSKGTTCSVGCFSQPKQTGTLVERCKKTLGEIRDILAELPKANEDTAQCVKVDLKGVIDEINDYMLPLKIQSFNKCGSIFTDHNEIFNMLLKHQNATLERKSREIVEGMNKNISLNESEIEKIVGESSSFLEQYNACRSFFENTAQTAIGIVKNVVGTSGLTIENFVSRQGGHIVFFKARWTDTSELGKIAVSAYLGYMKEAADKEHLASNGIELCIEVTYNSYSNDQSLLKGHFMILKSVLKQNYGYDVKLEEKIKHLYSRSQTRTSNTNSIFVKVTTRTTKNMALQNGAQIKCEPIVSELVGRGLKKHVEENDEILKGVVHKANEEFDSMIYDETTETLSTVKAES